MENTHIKIIKTPTHVPEIEGKTRSPLSAIINFFVVFSALTLIVNKISIAVFLVGGW